MNSRQINKIKIFNDMEERVDNQIMKENIERLFDFIDKEPNPISVPNTVKISQFGIFIAKYLCDRFTDEEKVLFTKRVDYHAESRAKAEGEFGNNKQMIDTYHLKYYGIKIYNEFKGYYWDHPEIKQRLLK
jgi:hypothetical protein